MQLFLPLSVGLSQSTVGTMMPAPSVQEGLRSLLEGFYVLRQGATRAEMLFLGVFANNSQILFAFMFLFLS